MGGRSHNRAVAHVHCAVQSGVRRHRRRAQGGARKHHLHRSVAHVGCTRARAAQVPYHSYLHETISTESQSKYVLNALRAKLDEAHQINQTTLSFIRSLNANDVSPLVYAFFDLQ
ncbi:unnamed protein product [Sphagnum balticum]